ncbi:aromatic ring-hydroxylating dioxygenase subunit alpha [Kineosporia sp. A_224]|uniref:aromatic ring-hydroxylating oxygenase subunit alpha n=1 Tax=Kineosporia sp. A_224 TaxID=1962180 RepID=UPI000B4AEE27|nr:aromatic ring-hydroxylating dioxygenase subunit alpha [Kineosporia sp. A_224]
MTGLEAALPREHYVDAGLWRHERDAVLRREWTCAGRLAGLGLDAAERLAVVEVHGESLLLTTDAAGTLHAHANVCRHRGARVVPHADGDPPAPCGAKALRCRYHSWTYGLDGGLLRAPHFDGVDGFDPARFTLAPVEAATWGGFVFVRLLPGGAPSGPSLTESLGAVVDRTARYPLDRLVSAYRAVYDVDANWKVIAENYNECLHCAGVHPELTRLVPAFGHGGLAPDGGPLDWEAGIPHRDGAWTFSFSGGSPRTPFPGLDADERTRHKGELVYPNLMLSLSAEHAASFLLEAVGVARTRVTFDVLVAPEEAHLDVEDCAGFWDLVNRQDWEVCASVQSGMSSAFYEKGWYGPMEDDSLDIRRWLLPRLAAHRPPGATAPADDDRAG